MGLVEDRFDDDNDSQARFYLASLFEERRGYVAVAYGHNPKMTKPRFEKEDFVEQFYKWPEEGNKLLDDVDELLNGDTRHDNVEVFICPALRKSPSRKAGTNAPLMWVWADLDAKPDKEQLDRMNTLGAMTILSGSEGHRHVYIPLVRPVSNVAHKALCIALKEALKCKDSKIADNDLLRLPGTLNWKQLEPARVMVKRRYAAPRRKNETLVEQLTSMTGKPWASYKRQAEGMTPRELPDVRAVPVPKLKGASRAAYSYQPTEDGSRHDAIYKLVKTMQEDGYSRDEMHVVLYDYPPAVSKWGTEWRIANDIDRIWQKFSSEAPVKKKKTEQFHTDDDGSEQPLLKFHDWATVVARVDSAPPPEYLFNGIWVEGDYGVLSAPDKSGKSWSMLDAAISCASATPWMNKWDCPNGGPVVICFGEGSERKQIRRARAVAASKGIDDEEFMTLPIHPMFSVPQINDDDHLEELETKIRRVKPALVIIDPFYLAASGADSANLVQMGTMLNRIQLVCQRHNAALMLSHHWNKSSATNGDVHSRSSGVGLTAWGRVLISMDMTRAHTDPTTMRSTVSLSWHIKGDEIAEQRVDLIRDVWEDEPGNLGCAMNYQVTLSTEIQGEQAKPIQNAPTMERISTLLQENLGGMGIRKLMTELRATKAVSQQTTKKCLDQLLLHDFIQEGPQVGQNKPYLSVKPFSRDMLDEQLRLKSDDTHTLAARVARLSADQVGGYIDDDDQPNKPRPRVLAFQ
jgi:hypothetical protein